MCSSMASKRDYCGNCDAPLIEKQLHSQVLLFCPSCAAYWNRKMLKLVHDHRVRPPDGCQLSFVFEPNHTSHSDLVLRVGSWALRSDSYYYQLDRPAGEAEDAVRSIRAMLVQWKKDVAEAQEGEPFYLPHNFSDQSTGWLRGVLKDGGVHLQAGWSMIEGWSFYPSSYALDGIVPTDFSLIEELSTFEISTTDMLADIDQSLNALTSATDT